MILLLLTPRPLNLQSSKQLMVRKTYVYFIHLQQAWIEKSSLMFVDIDVESSELIQPDTIGASSVVPSSQIEAILEKVQYLLHRLSYYQLIQSS